MPFNFPFNPVILGTTFQKTLKNEIIVFRELNRGILLTNTGLADLFFFCSQSRILTSLQQRLNFVVFLPSLNPAFLHLTLSESSYTTPYIIRWHLMSRKLNSAQSQPPAVSFGRAALGSHDLQLFGVFLQRREQESLVKVEITLITLQMLV